ncbi:MAG TPA: NAD-dependent epimerase/dehydratase family protein [Bacillota bacterium]|nr:NAD-dependent epimerase/dehydratase family protein [Bacillota bacterium]
MRVLVIGGTSFVGPHVVRRLSDMGHEVAVFHRGRTEADLPAAVKHIHGDRRGLADFKDEFQRLRPDVVLHMIAGQAQDAWALMQTLPGIAGRVVVISSQDVYRAYNRLRNEEPGFPDPVPLSESAPLRERLHPYRDEPFPGTELPERRRDIDDYDKILVERLILSEPRLPATVLRLPAVYGPNDPQRRLFGYLKRMDDKRAAILLDARAAQWRWTRGYVEDVAHAIVLAVTNERSQGEVYNVGEIEGLTEMEWVKQIGDAAGWNGRVVAVRKELLPSHLKTDYNWAHHLVADTGRIRRELGYRECVPRNEAVRATVTWERANPPSEVDGSQFDYAAEDAALAALVERGG